MDSLAPVISSILATLLVASAALKLSHEPAVVHSYAKLGVKEEQLNVLAVLLLAGAAGLAGSASLQPPRWWLTSRSRLRFTYERAT